MDWKTLTPLLLAPAMSLVACSGTDVRIVEANPELMYELGTNRSGEIVILEGEKPSSQPTRKTNRRTKAGGLRLPSMVDLPTKQELDSDNSSSSGSGGGVISRPPVD